MAMGNEDIHLSVAAGRVGLRKQWGRSRQEPMRLRLLKRRSKVPANDPSDKISFNYP